MNNKNNYMFSFIVEVSLAFLHNCPFYIIRSELKEDFFEKKLVNVEQPKKTSVF